MIRAAKQQVLRELKNAVGKAFTPSMDDLSDPPQPEMGDIAFPCFSIAKQMKKNPAELATELAAKIGAKEHVAKVTSNGPYVNFFWADDVFGAGVLEDIFTDPDAYGASDIGKDKRVMVEYAQPNTHKMIHVGHLRNFTVGHAAVNVLKKNGFDVVPVSYINDLGMHVATCLWGIKRFYEDDEREPEERMQFLSDAYVRASKEIEEQPEKREEVSEIHRQLEKKEGDYVGLWKKTRKWSLDYIRSIFEELALPIEQWYYESDLIQRTRRIIEDLIEDGVVAHSEGAWIVDLEDEDLGVNLLVKSDGTLLYNAKDIALALKKEEDYHPQRSVYVIDARQSLAMRQLFATLKRMGFKKDLSHLSYEFVTLPEGAMSSRKGNVVPYAAFRDELVRLAEKETRERHVDWDERNVRGTAESIAYAAMRFDMLKQDLDKKITFDLAEAVSFDGFTGPYLLYTVARIQSLLKKAEMKPDRKLLQVEEVVEHRLLNMLADFPDVMYKCGNTLRISALPQYLFDLAKTFSEFYETIPVIQAENEALIPGRLALVQAVGHVLENGLDVLGIDTVDEM